MRRILSCIFMLAIGASSVFASGLEDADYTTPDSWQVHTTPQGITKTANGHKFGDGTLNVSLTSRYKLLDNDYQSDQNFYQYLKADVTSVSVGQGTMSGVLFMRAGKDIDGDGGYKQSGRYYFRDDILDAEDSGWAVRMYQGFLKFSGVVKNTNVTIGNQYVTHIDTIHMNGVDADVALLDDKLTVYAFGGQPDTFYLDDSDSKAAGAGFVAKLTDRLKLSSGYTYVDMDDETSDIYKLRADYTYAKGRVSGEYGNTDGNGFYTLDGVYRNNPTKTTLTLSFQQLLDEIGKGEGTYISNPITYSLSPYGKYTKVKAKVYQGLGRYMAAGLGAEVKNRTGEDTLDNRSYVKYSGNLDFIGLFTPDTFLSLTADYWNVAESIDTEENSQVAFGGELTQVLSDKTNLWLGSRFNRFEYDLDNGTEKNWVREIYLGGEHKLSERAALSVDMSYENSQILKDLNTDLEQNYSVELWLSLAI